MDNHSNNPKEPLVIKLGGSIFLPNLEKINTKIVYELEEIFKKYFLPNNLPMVIIIGGGAVNRFYNSALQDFPTVSNEDLDWMGIYTIHLNAACLRIMFGDLAYKKEINHPDEFPKTLLPLIYVCGAYAPGRSSNFDAVEFSTHAHANMIINISNIDFVYDKDPRSNPDAIAFSQITWEDYEQLIPKEMTAKLSVPFDPVATRDAKEQGKKVWFLSGKTMDPITEILDTGSTQHGTLIGAIETIKK